MKSHSPILRRSTANALLCAAFVIALASYSHATTDRNVREYRLKAAFLYNFAKFVEWPDEHSADHRDKIIITVLGEDPFGQSIDAIQNRSIRGKKVIIKRARTIDDLEPCDIVFIAASEKERTPRILEDLASLSTLSRRCTAV
jgi:hypothetical protein